MIPYTFLTKPFFIDFRIKQILTSGHRRLTAKLLVDPWTMLEVGNVPILQSYRRRIFA